MYLRKSDDIETNPDPRRFPFIRFCHWNLNGLATHDFVKMPLIEAFTTTHNFDIICLVKTFLESSIDISDTRIHINDYSPRRADHPSNTKFTTKTIYLLSRELTYLIFKNVWLVKLPLKKKDVS